MSDPMDFEFTVAENGTVTLDGVQIEESQPVEEAAPVEADSPGVDEIAQLRRERDQLREKAELYDSFEPMIAAIGRGEMEVPAPPVTPEAVVGYRRRLSTPGSAEILAMLRDYAETLPEHEKQALESNHTRFNQKFDEIAALVPAPVPRVSRRMAERVLRQHEMRLDAARSERSGVFPEVSSDNVQRNAEILKRRIRAGDRDSEIALAKLLVLGDS